MIKLKDLTITIVGLGMEGGSYAIALRENVNPQKIYAVDVNHEALVAAQSLKVIDEGFSDPQIPFSQSDLIIMAIYPAGIADYIKQHQVSIKSGALITDVAGTKTRIVNEIQAILRPDLDFVAGHPMAGNENRGFLFADKKIFQNANYIITPHEKNRIENITLIESLATAIGCTNIIKTDPVTHDQRMAYASQLVHAIAASITNCDSFDESLTNFVGGSFRDITRVAKINADLWTDAFLENKVFLIEEIDKFQHQLSLLKKAIEDNDANATHEFLQRSFDKRSKNKF